MWSLIAVSSYSRGRTQEQVSEARKKLAEIRTSGQSLRRKFLARWGEEIEAEWREIGKEYIDARRGVTYPEDPNDALLFSILCIFTYRLYEREPWGPFDWTFPPMAEVVQLMRDSREEIVRAEVTPPSYTMQMLGFYNTLWEG